jgi:hypothetical protein
MNKQHDDEQLSVEDIERAIGWLAGAENILHLVTVRLTDLATGASVPVDTAWLERERIYWLAIQDEGGSASFLLAPLYSEKLHKIIRKWNRTDSQSRFETRTTLIGRSEAASFYSNAWHKETVLLRSLLNRLRRDEQQTLRILRREAIENISDQIGRTGDAAKTKV